MIYKCESHGITCVIINKGIIKTLPRPPKVGILVHFSASTSLSTAPNRKMLTGSVKEALRLGADGVSLHINIGGKEEPEMLADLGMISEGDTVNHDDWDVAFRGSTIIVNGGDISSADQPNRSGSAAVYIANGVMSDIRIVDVNKLIEDGSTRPAIIDDLGISGQGWASYNQESHILSPIAGKILVFRAHDHKYAKMEILYYYDSEDPQPSQGDFGGFYTFNYVYQSNGTINF